MGRQFAAFSILAAAFSFAIGSMHTGFTFLCMTLIFMSDTVAERLSKRAYPGYVFVGIGLLFAATACEVRRQSERPDAEQTFHFAIGFAVFFALLGTVFLIISRKDPSTNEP